MKNVGDSGIRSVRSMDPRTVLRLVVEHVEGLRAKALEGSGELDQWDYGWVEGVRHCAEALKDVKGVCPEHRELMLSSGCSACREEGDGVGELMEAADALAMMLRTMRPLLSGEVDQKVRAAVVRYEGAAERLTAE